MSEVIEKPKVGRPKGRKNGPRSAIAVVIEGRKLAKTLQEEIFSGKKLDMARVKAVLGLLSKVCPSLQSIETKVDGEIRYAVSAEAISVEQWNRQIPHYLGTSAGTTESSH